MNRAGRVYLHERFTGIFQQDEDGYSFTYDGHYLKSEKAIPISLKLPLREESYRSKTMLPFFDGLIPEGYLLDESIENKKLHVRDRMGLLLTLCKVCTGAVSILPAEEVNHG